VAYRLLGETYFGAGMLAEAADVFQRAVRIDPTDAEASLGTGKSLVAMGRYADAIVPLRESIRLSPRESEGYRQLAMACKHLDRLDEALGRS
jgi:Flp pilus assembly protein TadD